MTFATRVRLRFRTPPRQTDRGGRDTECEAQRPGEVTSCLPAALLWLGFWAPSYCRRFAGVGCTRAPPPATTTAGLGASPPPVLAAPPPRTDFSFLGWVGRAHRAFVLRTRCPFLPCRSASGESETPRAPPFVPVRSLCAPPLLPGLFSGNPPRPPGHPNVDNVM
jgi:hypothetical protein